MVTSVALGGCEGPLSTLDPAGPAARTIATLWWVMLVGTALIFALVMALVTAAFRRPRSVIPQDAPGDEMARERLFVVKLGIAFPVVVLMALLAYGLVVGERLLPRETTDVLRVEASASRSDWYFSYGDLGRTSRNTLHIPAGRDVDVAITTLDVIHSFWVPRLAGKLDAIPGHTNVLRIVADRPGTYAGLSAEFSGPGYSFLKFEVVAHDDAEWADFMTAGTE